MRGPRSMRRMNIKKILRETATWILTLLLAAMFLNAGIRKFFEAGGWSEAFRHMGYPVWFRIFIGFVETAAGLLLLVPRTAPYAAVVVIVVMIGAIGSNISAGFPIRGVVPAVVCLIVGGIILALRWKVRYSFQRRMDSIR